MANTLGGSRHWNQLLQELWRISTGRDPTRQIWLGVSCLWWRLLGQGWLTRVLGNPVFTSCGRYWHTPRSQALTLLGGARFIAWCLRCPFLGECWLGLRYFGECRACLGYGSAPGSTLKSPWAVLVRFMGRATNTVIGGGYGTTCSNPGRGFLHYMASSNYVYFIRK